MHACRPDGANCIAAASCQIVRQYAYWPLLQHDNHGSFVTTGGCARNRHAAQHGRYNRITPVQHKTKQVRGTTHRLVYVPAVLVDIFGISTSRRIIIRANQAVFDVDLTMHMDQIVLSQQSCLFHRGNWVAKPNQSIAEPDKPLESAGKSGVACFLSTCWDSMDHQNSSWCPHSEATGYGWNQLMSQALLMRT